MGWENVNLAIDPTVEDFVIDVNNVALEVYTDAMVKTDERHQETLKTLGEVKPSTPEEAADLGNEQDWQKELHRNRMNSLGLFPLLHISSALKRILDHLKRPFHKSHPSKDKYKGKGWLLVRQDEYLKRFGIDFNRSPVPFERIQEIVLARNAGVHSNSIDQYKKKVSDPRFIDKGSGELRFKKDDLRAASKDVVEFVRWLGEQLKTLRRSAETT